MELTYICSRLRSDEKYSIEFHFAVAEVMCRTVVKESGGKQFPIAPHLYLPHFLNDSVEEERQLACALGIKALQKCRRMKVVVVDGIISEGMLAEIYAAQSAGIQIDYFYCSKSEMEELINKTFGK